MKERLERLLSLVLTGATVCVAAVVIRREFAPPPARELALIATEVSNWTDALSAGTELTNTASRVKVVVFSDLECSACRAFHRDVVDSLAVAGNVSVTVVHRPLPGHRFARSAAVAAECAGEQARFGPFVARVLEKQDSIGLKMWSDFAKDAGVPDSGLFSKCIGKGRASERVAAAVAIADRIGVHSTPTVMINQWQLNRPPRRAELSKAIAAVADGRRPQ